MNKMKSLGWLVIGLLFMQFTTDQDKGIPQKATDIAPLLIGEMVPDVEITNLQKETVKLKDVVKKKPTVLIYYRGGWCPYCSAHLAAVGKAETEINQLGYQIIGISPDAPVRLETTQQNKNLGYQLYSDSEGKLMRGLGIAFTAAERHKARLAGYSNDKNPGLLPVPSLYVIDTDGTIAFEYISPNYKKRISADMLLGVLNSLKSE